MTLANRITIGRILGVPVFILLMLYYKAGLAAGTPWTSLRMAAAGLFVILALSDALDGYIARTYNQVTRLGTMLDPIADKALLVSVLLLFTRPGLPALEPQFPVWFALLVLSREAILILGSFVIHALAGTVSIRARVTGKLATGCFMASVILALTGFFQPIFEWMVLATGLLIAISAVQYLIDGFKQLEPHAAVNP